MSLGGTGLRDWRVQRFTAIFLGLYTFYIFYFLLSHHDINYNEMQGLFSQPWMQISTLLALISTVLHAWIGLWTVLTDYVKSLALRYLLQFFIIIALFWYVVWGVWILWGI